jgi:hypothetical protein
MNNTLISEIKEESEEEPSSKNASPNRRDTILVLENMMD